MFTADDVVRTALSLGINDFTVSGVARALHVTPSALYRHFRSRDQISEAALRNILTEVSPHTRSDNRESVLREFTTEWCALVDRHPGFGEMVAGYRGALRCVLESPFRTYLDQLTRLEVTTEQVIFAGILITSALQRVEKYRPHLTAGSRPLLPGGGIDHQRAVTVDFIVESLCVRWPAWSLPVPHTATSP